MTLTPKRGLFQRLRVAVSGERDAVDQQLDALAHQGAGMARLAHMCATLLVVLFSAGSLVALGADALTKILSEWNHSHQLDIPSTITVCVSTLMVLAMDVAMLNAASMLRLLSSRRAELRERLLHIAVMGTVAVLESGTYLYMSWIYEHPTTAAAGALIGARALAAPLLAVYLSMSRVLPITSRDILAQAELASGAGVLRDVSSAAKDQDAPLHRKLSLYQAAAIMTPEDEVRLKGMIKAVQAQTFLLTGTVPDGDGPGSGSPNPDIDESRVVDADREPQREHAENGANLRIIGGKGRSRKQNGNGSRNTRKGSSALSYYDKQEALGFKFLDSVNGNATRTQLQDEIHCRPTTAQKILNRWRREQRQKA